jgi:hypothetical protein
MKVMVNFNQYVPAFVKVGKTPANLEKQAVNMFILAFL